MKDWYKSKTIQIAIVQAIIMVVVAFESQSVEFKALGVGGFLKSLLDIFIRFTTYEEIK